MYIVHQVREVVYCPSRRHLPTWVGNKQPHKLYIPTIFFILDAKTKSSVIKNNLF